MSKKLMGLFGLLGLLVFLIMPCFAQAATFRVSRDGTQTVTARENLKNLYIVGSTINSDANILGDLVAAGANLNINGSVEQSIIAAGSNVNVKSDIGGNARLAGTVVNYDGKIDQDLSAAGGTITISENSVIGGDILLVGGQIVIGGNTLGNAHIGGSTVTINGKINGNVIVKNVTKLTLGSAAVIGGNLTYSSLSAADVSAGAVVKGATDYQKLSKSTSSFNFSNGKLTGVFGTISFVALITTFLTLLVVFYLFPKSTSSFVERSFAKPWANLGWGFIVLIVVPVAGFILLGSIIGSYLGLFLFGIYALLVGLAKLLSVLLIGALCVKWLNKGKMRIGLLAILFGSFAVLILGLIPVFGWIVLLGFMLVAIGQLAQNFVWLREKNK